MTFEKYPAIYEEKRKELFVAASFLLTENCNLRCKYCFEKANRQGMSMRTLQTGMKFLYENAKAMGSSSVEVCLFGGEPTLRADLIEEACRYRRVLEAEGSNITVNLQIITNATNMTKELEWTLREEIRMNRPIHIQLSVDGPEDIQNLNRVTESGAGSWDMVAKAVPKWIDIYKTIPQSLSVHGCLQPDTIHRLFESFMYFRKEWGREMLWFLPVCEAPWTAEHVAVYGEQLEKITDFLIAEMKKTGDPGTLLAYAPLDRCTRDATHPGTPCGAGKTYCTITADGSIWPCHNFYFGDSDREMCLGNVWDGVDDDARRIFLEYSSEDLDCPRDCDHGACFRCIAVNHTVNGNMFSQVRGHYCDMMKQDQRCQKKAKEAIDKMGLTSNREPDTGTPLRPEEVKFPCVKVVRESGSCYIVDLAPKKNMTAKEAEGCAQVYPDRVINGISYPIDNPDLEDAVLNTWVENGITYDLIRSSENGKSRTAIKERKKEVLVAKPSPCSCDKGCSPSDEGDILTLLRAILGKLEEMEKHR